MKLRRSQSLSTTALAPLPSDAMDPFVSEDVAAGPLDLESVYRRHGAAVARWAERLMGPGADLEDVVHDVFMVVERRLPEWRGDAKITTWLYEITIRVVQQRRRAAHVRRWLWPFTRGAEEAMAELPADAPTPLDALMSHEARSLLYKFLDDLPESYRTAVILFELEGRTCQEIATLTSTSVANVWARVSRGRAKLLAAFEAWEAGRAAS